MARFLCKIKSWCFSKGRRAFKAMHQERCCSGLATEAGSLLPSPLLILTSVPCCLFICQLATVLVFQSLSGFGNICFMSLTPRLQDSCGRTKPFVATKVCCSLTG